MILELDCGNSFIKWRINGRPEIYTSYSLNELFTTLAHLEDVKLSKARISSVRSDGETNEIAAKIKMRFGIKVQVAKSTPYCAGVTNGYLEPHKLGVDRWLDVIASYHLYKSACMVLDLGTAITVDFVDNKGKHLGGFICPGLPLMRNSLQVHTSKILYDFNDASSCLNSNKPATFTAEAVERGCATMICNFAREQANYAAKILGKNQIVVTGGDANLVKNSLNCANFVPDLVFIGLALACP